MDGSISRPASTRTKISLVGVALGAGGADPGCREGPAALRESNIVDRLKATGINASWSDIAEPGQNDLDALETVAQTCEALAPVVRDTVAGGLRPVVVGGDHSCAIGTWSGVGQTLGSSGPMGLLWIDAHMDSHTPETSPSGRHHGMPLAVLMGHGDPRLTSILAGDTGVPLDPRHLCLIGVRCYEAEEADLLDRLGVRVFDMAEVTRRGLDAVIADALKIVGDGTAGFGLSIDLDAVDPMDAPGVGLPVPDGIRGADLVAAFNNVPHLREFAALEIVEFNPSRDKDNKTRNLLTSLIATAIRVE